MAQSTTWHWKPLNIGITLTVLSVWAFLCHELYVDLANRYRGPTKLCDECGYNLTGVTSDKCPECGAARS